MIGDTDETRVTARVTRESWISVVGQDVEESRKDERERSGNEHWRYSIRNQSKSLIAEQRDGEGEGAPNLPTPGVIFKLIAR